MPREFIPRTSGNCAKVFLGLCPGAQAERPDDGGSRSECPATLAETYEKFHERILRLALRITRNLQDAEDVVQECFMQAFLHLDSFSGKSKLSTWISRIAINAALMKIRRRRRFEVSLDEPGKIRPAAGSIEIERDGLAPDEQYLRRELAQILAEGLAELSPGLLRVVDLYYFEELSARECAQVLGISMSSAKSRILRARLKLRPAFDKRVGRPSVPSRLVAVHFHRSAGRLPAAAAGQRENGEKRRYA